MSINCGHCEGTHRTVSEVRMCSAQHGASYGIVQEPRATERQVAFMKKLLDERDCPADIRDRVADGISKSTASAVIEGLLECPKKEEEKTEELEDGVYFLDDTFYKIQHAIHGSGQQYVKKLHVEEHEENGETHYHFSWEYEGKKPLKVLKAEHKVTSEMAKNFGLLYGICIRCAKTLTREESIHVGYGRTCAGHEGWWYPSKAEMAELTGKKVRKNRKGSRSLTSMS